MIRVAADRPLCALLRQAQRLGCDLVLRGGAAYLMRRPAAGRKQP